MTAQRHAVLNLYRICTEATGEMRQRAIDAVSAKFQGFTVLDAAGYWNGHPEASVVIEIHASEGYEVDVMDAARAIRGANSQECVLVQVVRGVERRFVHRDGTEA